MEKEIIQSESAEVKENWFKRFGKGFCGFWKDEFVGTWKWFFTKGNVTPATFIIMLFNIFFLLVSNIIAVKTVVLYGFESGIQFALPAAVVIYTFNIVLSDLVADVKKEATRFTCQAGFLLNAIMVLIFTISIQIPGVVGNNMESAGGVMDTVLGSSWFLFISSALSFYIGDLANDLIFIKLKDKDGEGNGKLIKRCIVSTVFGQLLDATIFIILGLQVFPGLVLGYTFTGGSSLADPIGWANMGIMIGLQWVVKVVIEAIVSPLVVLIRNKLRKIDNI